MNVVSDPQMKHLFMFNQLIAMRPSHQIIGVFMSNIYRQNDVMGNRTKVPERETESSRLVVQEKERWLNLEVARVLEMTVGKLNTCIFLSIKIRRTTKVVNQKGSVPNSSFNLRLYFQSCATLLCIIKRVSWFKSSLLLRIQSDSITNINS